MGTPEFAVASLQLLVENNYEIAAVVTAADKPAGRGQKLQESAVKKYAQSQGIPILQPEKLKAPEFVEALKNINADLFIVVAFRMLPEVIWTMPPLGTFNLHGSLLPQYRGAAPINWAVINGEKETGVTTFFLQQQIDTGNIIDQAKLKIEKTDNAGKVHDDLMEIGSKLVLKTVKAIEQKNIQLISQEEVLKREGLTEADIKHAPKIFKADCKIDWTKPAEEIQNLIRGLSPYPTAYTDLKGLTLKIFASDILESNAKLTHHSIDTDGKTYFRIAANDAWLDLKEVQLEGKKKMMIDDFLRGWRA